MLSAKGKPAGAQEILKNLDSGFRRNDGLMSFDCGLVPPVTEWLQGGVIVQLRAAKIVIASGAKQSPAPQKARLSVGRLTYHACLMNPV